jgi:hypothetical protein
MQGAASKSTTLIHSAHPVIAMLTRARSTAVFASTLFALMVRPSQAPTGQFTPLPPNQLGRIPVLEYHQITDHDADYVRSRETFRKELDLVYSRGYRPITMTQLLNKDFSDVPVGMSPVVYTFDDASPSQFRYIVGPDSQPQIDPESALGIWLDFAKRHPDWKGKAVFCVLNGGSDGHNFFGDGPNKGTVPKTYEGQRRAWRFLKVKWLADNGFELCDHTLWHMQLSKYPADKVQWQIAANIMGIDSAVPGYMPRTMALPQGLWPKPPSLAWQGSWTDPKSGKTVAYHFGAVLEVAGGPARSPFDPKFNGDSIPRVQMSGTQLVDALNQLDKVAQADQTKSRFVR